MPEVVTLQCDTPRCTACGRRINVEAENDGAFEVILCEDHEPTTTFAEARKWGRPLSRHRRPRISRASGGDRRKALREILVEDDKES